MTIDTCVLASINFDRKPNNTYSFSFTDKKLSLKSALVTAKKDITNAQDDIVALSKDDIVALSKDDIAALQSLQLPHASISNDIPHDAVVAITSPTFNMKSSLRLISDKHKDLAVFYIAAVIKMLITYNGIPTGSVFIYC